MRELKELSNVNLIHGLWNSFFWGLSTVQLWELHFLWTSHSELRQTLKNILFPHFLVIPLILCKNFPGGFLPFLKKHQNIHSLAFLYPIETAQLVTADIKSVWFAQLVDWLLISSYGSYFNITLYSLKSRKFWRDITGTKNDFNL